MRTSALLPVLAAAAAATAFAQVPPTLTPDAARRVAPAYPVAYEPAKPEEVAAVLERVRAYLDRVTPVGYVDARTGAPVAEPVAAGTAVRPAPTDFGLATYEWGVTYSGMLLAAEATGDRRFADYVATRLDFIVRAAALFREETLAADERARRRVPFRAMNQPQSLDDSGSMAAAMIKAVRAGQPAERLRPQVDRYLDWISHRQLRLEDGTLARHRPLHFSLWLDDLYMSVPALAQMARLTGDGRYFDDAARQVEQFHARMFVPARGLFMHGWVQGMDPHPVFHWARANGWAVVALAELLSELPETHPRRDALLAIFRAHAAGLAACQGSTGLWHQLLDRPDSYRETSATAMFVFSIARGVNRGWLDARAYAGLLSTGWNAVAQQVNAAGQVENVCVGTGMGFDPSFYYHRPVSVYAAHGYGPALLAGAEMIAFRRGRGAEAQVSDGAVQLHASPSRH